MLIFTFAGVIILWIVIGVLSLITNYANKGDLEKMYKSFEDADKEWSTAKDQFLSQIAWNKFLKIVNGIVYVKYPPEIDFSVLERREPGGNLNMTPFYSAIVQIFKEIMEKHTDTHRIIVEIYERVKDEKGHIYDVCTISFTSTMENLKSLNWANLSPSEVMRNIDSLSDPKGLNNPFSVQYLHINTRKNEAEKISNKNKYDKEMFIDNLIDSLMNYAKSAIGESLTVDDQILTVKYEKKFPRLTQKLKELIPCLIFQHIATYYNEDDVFSVVKIWGYAGYEEDKNEMNKRIRKGLMKLVVNYFSDKYKIEFKENSTTKGWMNVSCSIRKIEPTSHNIVDRYRFYASLEIHLPYVK